MSRKGPEGDLGRPLARERRPREVRNAEVVPPLSRSLRGEQRLRAETAALLDRANLTVLVLGCIEAKCCKKICV